MNRNVCRFGPFVVDRTAYVVTRDGRPVTLTPKLLDLLLYLIDRPAKVVAKEELLDALWPGANVTENALTQAISELRQALGDEAGSPRFIKTIARRGYRFIAGVEIDDTPTQKNDSTHDTIAVVDFANVTGEQDFAWLAIGIAETVTADLRALGRFKVVERWRVIEAARRTDGSSQQIAAALAVRRIVAGSFQRHGDSIRIVARVVDVSADEALADAKVDGPIERIFDLQDQIVVALSKGLGFPSGPTRSGLGARETANLAAYRAFMEGWLRLESLDMRELNPARADFERAVSLDPRYALAYTGLSSAEFALYETTRFGNEPARDLLERAIAHARHAIELDEGLAEAHASLVLPLVSAWQPAEARAAAQRAVALEPSNWRHLFRLSHASWGNARLDAAARTAALYPEFAFTHFGVAMVHVARNHLTRAETVLREGIAVQTRQVEHHTRFPALGLHWLLGLVRLARGDASGAVDEFDREVALTDPERLLYGREYRIHAYHGCGLAQLHLGYPDKAIASFKRALDVYSDHAPTRIAMARALRLAGASSAANAELVRVDETLSTLARRRPYYSAIVGAALLVERDRPQEAIGRLDNLLADAPPGFAAWTLPVEPLLRPLTHQAGFASVLHGLADRAT